ncbi:MAG: DUF4350 domain-containing protein [Micropepsaceae bacterium]
MSTRAPAPASTFSPKVAITLFLVGVFSFSAFITLSTFAPDFMDGDDAQAHALSRSAIGYSGMVKLLKSMREPVTIRRTEPARNESRYLVILTPRSPLKQFEIKSLGSWRTLVVLPKWFAAPSMKRNGWVGPGVPQMEVTVAETLEELAPKLKVKRTKATGAQSLRYQPSEAKFLNDAQATPTGSIESFQTISAPNLTPVLQTASGETVLGVIRERDKNDVYVLSEPDLLNNQGIADIATAKAGIALLSALKAAGDPIAFDLTLNGFLRSRSIMRLAFEPPLLALTLSFVLVSALIAWRAATRDGPASRTGRKLAFGKLTLAENSAALFRLAGREHTMARRYADLVRSTTAAHLGLSQDNDDEVTIVLDRVAVQKHLSGPFSGLASRAAAARTAAEALASAKELQSWKQEITRATR